MYQLKNPEDIIQKAVCDYLTLQRVLFYAVPNGYKKSKFERWKAMVTGLKRGVLDLVIPEPMFHDKDYHGMYLELKAPKGRMSPEQKEWKRELELRGYYCAVAYSFDEAKKEIDQYLKLK